MPQMSLAPWVYRQTQVTQLSGWSPVNSLNNTCRQNELQLSTLMQWLSTDW